MKRQVLAVVVGSLFALPAFANNEIDAGNLPQPMAPSKSTEQVRAELVQAQRSGNVVVNAELGTTAKQGAPMQHVGKSRDEVRAELEQAYRSGEIIINAELGTTANRL